MNMNKLKTSRFVYGAEKNDDIILYHSLYGTNNILKIKSDMWTKESSQINMAGMDEETKEVLLKYGYLIDESEEELAAVNQKRERENQDYSTVRIIVMTTMNCNFDCKYCYERKNKERLSEEAQEELVNKIEGIFQTQNPKLLNISWFGGEPMLAMDVIENLSKKLIDLCKKYKIMYLASITTNGFYLSINNIRRLMKYRVYSYQVTIDGTEETHNYQRPLIGGGNSYTSIIENIKRIQQEIKSGLLHFVLRVNVGISCIEIIEKILKDLEEKVNHDGRFMIMPIPISDWGGDRVLGFKDELLDEQMVKGIFKKAFQNPEILSYYLTSFDETSICDINKNNSFVVKPNGKLTRCSVELEEEYSMDELQDLSIAKVLEQDKKCEKCFLFAWCMQRVCPKKTNSTNCPIQKIIMEELLGGIPKDHFETLIKDKICLYRRR